jgi:hypothetical protein
MSMKEWEDQALSVPGAAEHVAQIEDELRLASGLTALRERLACRSGNRPGGSG